MVNRPKIKGTQGEVRVVKFLVAAGLNASRVVQHGTQDQGDIHIIGGHGCVSAMLEIKAGKQTSHISRAQREEWLEETRTESVNVGNVHAFLVIATHGASVCDYHVWSDDGSRFFYLDQFAYWVKGGF
jgi:hypothetical protein